MPVYNDNRRVAARSIAAALDISVREEYGWVASKGPLEATAATPEEAIGELLKKLCVETPEVLAIRLETLYG